MKKSLNLISFLMLAVMLTWATACDNNNDNTRYESERDSKKEADKKNDAKFSDNAQDDAEFVVDAYADGLAEVSMAERAKEKATTQEVRDLANMMITDHTKANQELKAIADRKGISLPTELTSRQSNHITRMSNHSGREFDEEYVDDLISMHRDAINLFEKASSQASDTEVRTFFSSKLPALRMHLEHAQKVEKLLKVSM